MNSVEQLGAKLSSLFQDENDRYSSSALEQSKNCVKLKLTYKKFTDSENMPGKYLKLYIKLDNRYLTALENSECHDYCIFKKDFFFFFCKAQNAFLMAQLKLHYLNGTLQ